jgi:hypothetical protein
MVVYHRTAIHLSFYLSGAHEGTLILFAELFIELLPYRKDRNIAL